MPPSPLPPLRVSPSLPSLWHSANGALDDDEHDHLPCVVDRDTVFPVSQPSTPDRLLSFAHTTSATTPTPPLTPSSATTTGANSNAWRSPTSPLTVSNNVKLAADNDGEHGIGLGLGLPFRHGGHHHRLEEDNEEDLPSPLRSLSLGDAEAFKRELLLRPVDDAEGRYLIVRGIPPTATNEEIHEVFTNTCARASPLSSGNDKTGGVPLRGICVRLLASHGIIVLAFHDPRHVASAERAIRAMHASLSPADMNGCDWKIDVSRIGEAKLREMLLAHSPNSPFNFISETEGVLLVCIESTSSTATTNASATRRAALDDVASIRLLLEGFGDVRVFETLPPQEAWYAEREREHGIAQAYKVEYFDARRGAQAREKLDGRSLFGTRLRVQAFSGSGTVLGSGGNGAHACQQLQLQIDPDHSQRTATTGSGAGDSDGQHGHGELLAHYAFPPSSISTTSTRSQPASPLGMLSALAPLSTISTTQQLALSAADPSRSSPSLPSSPLSSSASFLFSSKDRELLAAMSKAALASPTAAQSSFPSSPCSQASLQQQQATRRISTGSLVLTSPPSSSNSSSGTVTANVSPATSGSSLSGRALSPIRGKGSPEDDGAGKTEANVAVAAANAAIIHPTSSEQDLRRRAAVSAALQAQASKTSMISTAGSPSSSPSSSVGKVDREVVTDLVAAQRSPLKHAFPLDEDRDDGSGSNSPTEQTTFPSIWSSPLSPGTRNSGDNDNDEGAVYWDGEGTYPPPGPFTFPEMDDALPLPLHQSPTSPPPIYTTSGVPSSPFGIPAAASALVHPHQAFMQVQVPMTPVQRFGAGHSHSHSSAFGMLSPPQEDHRGVWGAPDGINSNVNSLSLSPPSSSLLPASPSSVFTPPRFTNRTHASGGAELLMSPLSPANMYRGPTPFNTPAGPFSSSSSSSGSVAGGPYAGGGHARARQHPPPHAHPPRSSGLYTSMRSPSSPSSRSSPTSASGAPSNEKNQIDLERIAAGLDTRTTVMVKNIPNKLSDKDLVEYIGKVCPRKIDFLYLRMDFQNGCNVGYAFVNFIRVEDLLLFASAKLGVKWNMFSSEKVLQMSYANYQGKEALVEKFKNSCVMDEREAWRPKIFYSSGPRQGLPEPFPSPTHLRRKERSSQNRGALFVPSPPSMYGGGGGSAQTTPRQEMGGMIQHGLPPQTLGGRYRGWVLPSHGSPSSSSSEMGMGMGMAYGHESLAPAPSLS